MPRYTEILKANGLSDDEIKAIESTLGANPKAVTAFDGMVIKAEEERKVAEAKLTEATEATTKLNKFWNDEATPQINDAYSKVAKAEAEAAFYKKQAESAKESGFIPADAPSTPAVTVPGSPTRNTDGTFTPSGAADPRYMSKEEGWKALSESSWALTEFQRLNPGQVMPDDIEALVREASSQRVPFRQYVEKKYDFQGRRDAIKAAQQKAHDDAIIKETTEKVQREYAERNGSNPDTRPGITSRFSKFEKGANQTNDRLSWSRPDAKERVRAMAHEAIAKEQVH